MSDCTHNCETCGQTCSDRKKESLIEQMNQFSDIKKVIGVISGKGGVGKSLVTSMMAVNMRRKGYNVAVLDADITGPSIPHIFGIHEKATACDGGIVPARSEETGIAVMSINLLLDHEDDPVLWRGPVIGGAVKQFWTDVCWGDVDYMFVDMPPGTGDVALTVFQSLPVDGIIIVTSPQELVSMIVSKAAMMAEMMEIPILGIVENMSYFECPDCHKCHDIFGASSLYETAAKYEIKHTARLPIDPAIAKLCDNGEIEKFNGDYLGDMIAQVEAL